MSANRVIWLTENDAANSFPDVENALSEPDGLLAAGGDLSSERLLSAYARGIFPWYEEGQPILWWSPDPRCILWPAELHVARRLRQQLRNSGAELTFNRAFGDVVRQCARKRRSQQGTWITPDMMRAYEALHDDGWAHSIEIRDGGDLIGGLYGICIGKVFFGESMFSSKANASKMAMIGLTSHMQSSGLELIDCQVVSRHLVSLGARLMPRADFSAFLDQACKPANRHANWPVDPIPVSELLIA
ncbi:MAG: leucyl/phenylalanyl-tRNA--protein transferase [Woeseiaceae bacterium]